MDTGLGSLRINLLLYILHRGLNLMAGDGGIRVHTLPLHNSQEKAIVNHGSDSLSLLKVNINHAAPRIPCHRACR